jgi:hypothetical protein
MTLPAHSAAAVTKPAQIGYPVIGGAPAQSLEETALERSPMRVGVSPWEELSRREPRNGAVTCYVESRFTIHG